MRLRRAKTGLAREIEEENDGVSEEILTRMVGRPESKRRTTQR